MEVKTLRIKPLGPLLFRGPGEFDPSSRGVYSCASSLLMPRPSTIVGTLITHLLIEDSYTKLIYVNSVNSFGKLLECYGDALDDLGIIALRGPYLYNTRKNVAYVPIRLGARLELVEYDVLRSFLTKDLLDAFLEKHLDSDLLIKVEHCMRELTADEHKPPLSKLLKTGIMLCDRIKPASRTSREGYIYTAEQIAYHRYVEGMELELRLKLVLSSDSPLNRLQLNKVVKIGGENKVANIHVDPEYKDEFDEMFSKIDSHIEYYLLLSPAPLKTVHDYLRGAIAHIGFIDTIGLGFSIARRIRKPIISALLEGSIVKASGEYFEGILRSGLYELLNIDDKELEVLARIGYATVIPIHGVEYV
jgi:CRISPR-associated protein Cmr3